MKIVADSHVDHGLSTEQVEYLKERYADLDGFKIESFELPAELGTVPCGLHGPLVGDEPVPESECRFAKRGNRAGESRLCDRPVRQTRTVTVIAGPHGDEACVLYTAFGGPLAPKEPWDPSLSDEDRAKARAFWSEHALSSE